ncbi:MAG: SDR family NAD(P)-dependent oxidoreductase, partial [Pseudomonadota bacterium]
MSLPTPPSFRLDGKRALVTGASRGLGLGGAVALAEAGAEVVMVARSADTVEEAASSLRAEGWNATGHALDVTDLDAMFAFVEQHGPFDVTYANAGTNKPTPYLDVTPDNYDM